MSETVLDVKGMNCPLPVLRANRALRAMAPGERLRVLATDRASVADFRAFCQETGHALLAFSDEGGVLSFVIRRRPDEPALPGSPAGGSPAGGPPAGGVPAGDPPPGEPPAREPPAGGPPKG